MDEWNDAHVMRYIADKNAAIGTPERTAAETDEELCFEDYYCQCNAVAAPGELDWNKCSACGKQLW